MPKSRSKRKEFRRHPPPKPKPKRSPWWVGALFFTLMGVGVLTIVLNYIFWDGAASRLFLGLGLVASSFVVATQWN
jgi:uncharacterized membrane protein YhaH (DUF805 family)